MLLAYLAAMETTAPTDPIAWLVNYGVAGVVIALLVLGRLRTKSEVDGLKEANEQLRTDLLAERAANAALVTQMTNHTLPQMAHLAEVLDRVPQAVTKEPETSLEHVLAQIAGSLARLEERPRGEA
jgi:uncharacterized protein YlaN (UPF0358 family)